MLDTGLLWFDDDMKRPLVDKVAAAVARYGERLGGIPTVCQVNPATAAQLAAQQEKEREQQRQRRRAPAPGAARQRGTRSAEPPRARLPQFVADPSMPVNYFLVGVEAREAPGETASEPARDTMPREHTTLLPPSASAPAAGLPADARAVAARQPVRARRAKTAPAYAAASSRAAPAPAAPNAAPAPAASGAPAPRAPRARRPAASQQPSAAMPPSPAALASVKARDAAPLATRSRVVPAAGPTPPVPAATATKPAQPAKSSQPAKPARRSARATPRATSDVVQARLPLLDEHPASAPSGTRPRRAAQRRVEPPAAAKTKAATKTATTVGRATRAAPPTPAKPKVAKPKVAQPVASAAHSTHTEPAPRGKRTTPVSRASPAPTPPAATAPRRPRVLTRRSVQSIERMEPVTPPARSRRRAS